MASDIREIPAWLTDQQASRLVQDLESHGFEVDLVVHDLPGLGEGAGVSALKDGVSVASFFQKGAQVRSVVNNLVERHARAMASRKAKGMYPFSRDGRSAAELAVEKRSDGKS